MSYRIEDFTRSEDGVAYPFSVCSEKTAETLRRLAAELVGGQVDDRSRVSGRALLHGVTVVHKMTVDEFACTTIILRLHEPKEGT